MPNAVIHDRGRGPEIQGTRITVHALLPNLLDPSATEASICELYDLTPGQVAAARAYVLSAPDVVLSKYMQIDEKMKPENPPEVIEKAKQARAVFERFKEWLARRPLMEDEDERASADERGLPTFQEWLAQNQREARSGSGL